MKTISEHRKRLHRFSSAFAITQAPVLGILLFFSFFGLGQVYAQSEPITPALTATDLFRLERVPIAGGAELVTIHAKWANVGPTKDSAVDRWVPMVTVLRDTLGDDSTENDRLRYVWPLTYTRPTTKQRLLGAVPFFYTRAGNKKGSSERVPPPVLDLASPGRDVWNSLFWTAFQSMLLDPYGMPVKASTRSYQQNISDYRKSHVIRALSVLALYQALGGESAFSESELSEIQARLRLTDKTFGGLVSDLNLSRYNEKQMTRTLDDRGHNWELLRQRAEAESLYFEPLELPDGSTTHALLWVSKADLEAKRNHSFDPRFLNIANPWADKQLANWKGHMEVRYFDSESRPTAAETPGARVVEMIPLALYGLDNPKIPMVLVDFRNSLNPKKREMSRRALQDLTRNVLSLSSFGQPAYFLGRSVFDFVTGRRGIDINQPSRLRTYAQLKLLLALNESLDPALRKQIDARLEKVSLNPLENDLEAESRLAIQQYDALLAHANRADGLPAKLDRDRRAELVPLEHGKAERVLFRVANILSFGKYTHREQPSPQGPSTQERLDIARRLSHHSRFLLQVAKSTPQVEVIWSLDEIKRSLQFIAANGATAKSETITAASLIFRRTADADTRQLCLDSLSRINSPKAVQELIRISQDKNIDAAGKELISSYLQMYPTGRKPENPLAASRDKAGDVTGQQ